MAKKKAEVSRPKKKYTPEFKEMFLIEYAKTRNLSAVCQKYDVPYATAKEWIAKLSEEDLKKLEEQQSRLKALRLERVFEKLVNKIEEAIDSINVKGARSLKDATDAAMRFANLMQNLRGQPTSIVRVEKQVQGEIQVNHMRDVVVAFRTKRGGEHGKEKASE
ncbi:MAG: hypothetical protein DRP25_02610 [Thermotoga sp.]|nr:MAG: hypothetical protein DRP25_02610 [Thermotoga sp.]